MSDSIVVKDVDGGAVKDLSTLGITLLDGEFPFLPAPVSITKNVPTMVGGYTYQNEPLPATIMVTLFVDGGSTNGIVGIFEAIRQLDIALPIATKRRLHPDIYGGEIYWTAYRSSGINSIPVGGRGAQFELEFVLDDPRPYNATTNVAIG